MSQFISLEQAIGMTETYRDNRELILDSGYQNQDILPLSETFDRDVFDTLLAQSGCEGVRVYFGMDSSLKVHAILVGVTDENEDIVPSEGAKIIEQSRRCPDDCPPPSPLNE